MYRESILGLALAATLAEIEPPLTARQQAEIWRVYDTSMEIAVAEAPLMSHIDVHVPPPSSVAGGGTTAVSTATPQFHVPAQSTQSTTTGTEEEEEGHRQADSSAGQAATSTEGGTASLSPSTGEPFDDRHIAFPVYRNHNGMWTVLLKDPTVVVRDEFGKSEKMQLDYLKVCMKDISASGTLLHQKGKKDRHAKKS